MDLVGLGSDQQTHLAEHIRGQKVYMRIIYDRLCMSRPMWPVCACMPLILVMFHVIHITLTRDLETYTIYACHPFVLPRVHLWRKISINYFARWHQKKVCVAEANNNNNSNNNNNNNNKMSPLDWNILLGLVIMLLCYTVLISPGTLCSCNPENQWQ